MVLRGLLLNRSHCIGYDRLVALIRRAFASVRGAVIAILHFGDHVQCRPTDAIIFTRVPRIVQSFVHMCDGVHFA